MESFSNPSTDSQVFIFPASLSQKRVWLAYRKNPEHAFYNIPGVLRALGHLDIQALRWSAREVTRRHESLRTRFREVNSELQQVIETQIDVDIPVIDVHSDSGEDTEQAVLRMVQQEVDTPFDLESAPLWRARLFRLGEEDHILVFVMNHGISDGYSLGVMQAEVSLLYSAFISGKPSPLPEPAIQYADFSEWERKLVRDKILDTQMTYWKKQLYGMHALSLPYDRPKLSPPPGRAGSHILRIEQELEEKLKSLSQQQGATLYMTLLAAYHALLYGWTGHCDIGVGCNIARRTRPEVANLIGWVSNTLIIRVQICAEWSFLELLARVKETTLAGYANQDIPMTLVDQELAAGNPNPPLLFNLAFTLLNFSRSPFQLGNTVLKPIEFDTPLVRHDITVFVSENPIILRVSYNRDLFDPETISALFQRYERLLQDFVSDPERTLSNCLS